MEGEESPTSLCSAKALHCIAWWRAYAAQTSEKLPDVAMQLTPFRYMKDIYEEYADDLIAAGQGDDVFSRTRFNHIFRTSPDLANIGIASGKENFGRCTVCGDLEEAIKSARKSGDALLIARKKQERLDHIMLERADKLSYYSWRDLARSRGPTAISCIIDKMDGNKNRCPSFARNPKAAHEQLKDAMTFHVVGLIFHGKPDSPHLFPAAPQLAGNSNLNCECFMRAVCKEYLTSGMLPLLHVQVYATASAARDARAVNFRTQLAHAPSALTDLDNASDNKSRWVLGFFAWLVKIGWVKEVRLSMMMVGHTHEDIDALFRRIAEYWARQGIVRTPSAFQNYLKVAIPGAKVHPLVEYVHDFASFFTDVIYDSVEGINDAREFVIRERDDGGMRPTL
eukprot:6211951-Pleurochrysis_carterae.AAC.2